MYSLNFWGKICVQLICKKCSKVHTNTSMPRLMYEDSRRTRSDMGWCARWGHYCRTLIYVTSKRARKTGHFFFLKMNTFYCTARLLIEYQILTLLIVNQTIRNRHNELKRPELYLLLTFIMPTALFFNSSTFLRRSGTPLFDVLPFEINNENYFLFELYLVTFCIAR